MDYSLLPHRIELIRQCIIPTAHYIKRIGERHGNLKQAINEVSELLFRGKSRRWGGNWCVHGMIYRHILDQDGDKIYLITLYADENNVDMIKGLESMINFIIFISDKNPLHILYKEWKNYLRGG